MDTWGSYVGMWITVLIRIGAVVMVLRLSWNLRERLENQISFSMRRMLAM